MSRFPTPRHQEIQDAIRQGKTRKRRAQKFFDWWEATPLENAMEEIVQGLKQLAIFDLLGALANITIALSLITYLSGTEERRQAQVNEAWQTILATSGQSAGAGRKRALEFLNSQPRQFPFFWSRWDRHPLDGLEAETAVLGDIHLPGASLYKAQFQEADLRSANLSNAYLEAADLSDADLSVDNRDRPQMMAAIARTNLTGANLRAATLHKTNLRQANLSRAMLNQANLTKADLSEAKLNGADLSRATLSKTNFSQADLSRAILRSVNLQDVVGLTLEQLTGATPPYLCNVALPPNLAMIDPNRDCAILPQGLTAPAPDIGLQPSWSESSSPERNATKPMRPDAQSNDRDE